MGIALRQIGFLKNILKHQQNKHFNQANKVHIKMNLFETIDERVTEFRDIP